MKKIFIGSAMAMTIGIAAMGQGLKVPDAVAKAFAARFPDAGQVKWGKENANEFEAEFKLNNNPVSANFKMDGSWVETETTIPATDLPGPVTSAIKTKYPSGTITGAERTDQPANRTIYEVAVKVDGKKRSLELDPNGKPVK